MGERRSVDVHGELAVTVHDDGSVTWDAPRKMTATQVHTAIHETIHMECERYARRVFTLKDALDALDKMGRETDGE